MPLRADPTTAAQDWANGLSQATDKIQRGIQRVQVAPGQKAAAKADKYRQGVLDNLDKWRAKTAAVSLGDWQSAAQAAVGRVAEGAQMKQGKFEQAMTKFFPHLASVVNRADSMPDSTLEQRIQKSAFVQRELAKYKGGGGGGGSA